MTTLKWEEPTPSPSARRNWSGIADELRANPGQWAIVAENTNGTTATHLRQGRMAGFRPTGSFEVTSRGNDSGRFTVYARYVGGGESR